MKIFQSFFPLLCCFALQATPVSGQNSSPHKPESTPIIAGWIENGFIGSPAIKVKVKLDTGAKSSSINAAEYHDYQRDGARWVTFSLLNAAGVELKIDAPVHRVVTIRRAGVTKRARPVIKLNVCVAGVTGVAEFNLADRSQLKYPILIGRTFLSGHILVDSSRTFMASERCQKQ